MRFLTSRAIGLLAVAAIFVLVSLPIVQSEVLGQDPDDAAQTAVSALAPTATTAPDIEQPAAPPASDTIENEPEIEQTTAPDISPDADSVEPPVVVSTETETPLPSLEAVETVAVADTATETVGVETTAATSTEPVLPADTTIFAVINLENCERSEFWRFEISNTVSAEATPASISVTFSGGATESIPRFTIISGGGVFTAFYDWFGELDESVVSASAVVDDGVVSTFQLTMGPPCPEAPTPTNTTTPAGTSTPTRTATPTLTPTVTETATPTIVAATIRADIDLETCLVQADYWRFAVSNSVSAEATPAFITMTFSGGAIETVPRFTIIEQGGVFTALYDWFGELGETPVSASAVVDASVDYEFALTDGPACTGDGTATATPTDTFTATPITPSATATDTFTATPITPSATATDTFTATPITPSATATDTFTATPITPSATATDTFTATPITPSSTPTDTATPTETLVPSSTPTQTATASATATASSTATPELKTISARIILTDCDLSSAWLFGIANDVSPDANPDFITISFVGGPTVTVPRDNPTAGSVDATAGHYVAYYTWYENLDDDLAWASADVLAGYDYGFWLQAGPGCVGPTATATPTHPVYPTAWPSHTPKPGETVTPVPGLPSTGSGSFGGGSGLVLLAGIVVLAVFGLLLRRRNLLR